MGQQHPRSTDDPDFVWTVYEHLASECRHFNNIESTYRTFASTWLLAAFAGMGFVGKEVEDPQEMLALVALIAGSAAIGICLLWLMDLLVYHRLLGAAFSKQLALEQRYAWLPRVGHEMWHAVGNVGVLPRIVWFYAIPYGLLAAISCGTAAVAMFERFDSTVAALATAAAPAVVAAIVGRKMYHAATTGASEEAVLADEFMATEG
ncbi:MAG: hypothetical protein ACM3SO_06345 [Betaproteobacteria bacterium]